MPYIPSIKGCVLWLYLTNCINLLSTNQIRKQKESGYPLSFLHLKSAFVLHAFT